MKHPAPHVGLKDALLSALTAVEFASYCYLFGGQPRLPFDTFAHHCIKAARVGRALLSTQSGGGGGQSTPPNSAASSMSSTDGTTGSQSGESEGRATSRSGRPRPALRPPLFTHRRRPPPLPPAKPVDPEAGRTDVLGAWGIEPGEMPDFTDGDEEESAEHDEAPPRQPLLSPELMAEQIRALRAMRPRPSPHPIRRPRL